MTKTETNEIAVTKKGKDDKLIRSGEPETETQTQTETKM